MTTHAVNGIGIGAIFGVDDKDVVAPEDFGIDLTDRTQVCALLNRAAHGSAERNFLHAQKAYLDGVSTRPPIAATEDYVVRA